MEKKAIIFDFDGTLTKKNQNIWKMLWKQCGYPTDSSSLYAFLYISHVSKKIITRKEWFDLTCEAFMRRNLDFKGFYEASKQIELIDGLEETVKTLHKNGYELHIVSGCISEAIKLALADSAKYFTFVESNRAIFNSDKKLIKLIPTSFDYEGKARYIEGLKEQGIKSENIVFVGNSYNDEWAYTSGCKTICINPDSAADTSNTNKWNIVINKLDNLKQILPLVDNSLVVNKNAEK